jgi:hypothetical protein
VDLTGSPPSTPAALITVERGVTLTLRNITFKGLRKDDGDTANNTASLIRVNNGGKLILEEGAVITGNTNGFYSGGEGGGVSVYGGTFTMSGGKISGNSLNGTGSAGGGVSVSGGTFEMSGGEISGNYSHSDGGGVSVYGGTFEMSGGKISGNSLNGTYGAGGGVYVYGSTFEMSGGEISGNSCYYVGGGVVVYDGTFTKTGDSVIYGNEADPANLRNTAANDGHAVFSPDGFRRNSTAGGGVDLDSSAGGSAGGWE